MVSPTEDQPLAQTGSQDDVPEDSTMVDHSTDPSVSHPPLKFRIRFKPLWMFHHLKDPEFFWTFVQEQATH